MNNLAEKIEVSAEDDLECNFYERNHRKIKHMKVHMGGYSLDHITEDLEAIKVSMDNGELDTAMDQNKLNLKTRKTKKTELNHGARLLKFRQLKMAASQTMATWVPDKMAAYQTRTTWIPDVNNDRCSENPLEKHKRKYNDAHKIYKIGNNRKYYNCGHIHHSTKYWGQKKKRQTDHGRFQEAEKFFGQPCYTGVRDCLSMVRQYPECGLS